STNQVDLWLKDVAPSNELRKWFAHEPAKWEEFKSRYWKELEGNAKFKELLRLVKEEDVTLVYAARDTEHNDAVALEQFIKRELEKPGT
ncbi:MAG: DUF488 family protein, partial [Candidatus Micrarchaeaceae archaeon]